MKVAINKCYGGFNLSDEAFEKLINEYGWKVTDFDEKGNYKDRNAQIARSSSPIGGAYFYTKRDDDISFRSNKDVIAVIEKLGVEAASGWCSEIKIVEVPDEADIYIEEYDGKEWIAESHQTWS